MFRKENLKSKIEKRKKRRKKNSWEDFTVWEVLKWMKRWERERKRGRDVMREREKEWERDRESEWKIIDDKKGDE